MGTMLRSLNNLFGVHGHGPLLAILAVALAGVTISNASLHKPQIPTFT